MPELPEVESLRRGLERLIVGQVMKRVEVKKPKLVSGKGNQRVASAKKTKEFIEGLTGATIVRVDRRAKNLIFRLKAKSSKLEAILLVHLKMSGQFAYAEHGKNLISGGHPIELSEHQLPNKHTHVIFELNKGTLYFNDTRMFGYLLYYPSLSAFESEKHFEKIGLEPFDPAFTAEYFTSALKLKSSKLKTVLMNQEIVVGLGNIYADEAMFEAGVRPTRPASSLSKVEAGKLYKAIKRILENAIKLGGSSVATYRLIDLEKGNYAREHKVYGKAGQKCSSCGSLLQKIIVNGRTTIYCPKCQK